MKIYGRKKLRGKSDAGREIAHYGALGRHQGD